MTIAQAAALLDQLPPTMLLCLSVPDDRSGVRAIVSLTTVQLGARDAPETLAMEVAVFA